MEIDSDDTRENCLKQVHDNKQFNIYKVKLAEDFITEAERQENFCN